MRSSGDGIAAEAACVLEGRWRLGLSEGAAPQPPMDYGGNHDGEVSTFLLSLEDELAEGDLPLLDEAGPSGIAPRTGLDMFPLWVRRPAVTRADAEQVLAIVKAEKRRSAEIVNQQEAATNTTAGGGAQPMEGSGSPLPSCCSGAGPLGRRKAATSIRGAGESPDPSSGAAASGAGPSHAISPKPPVAVPAPPQRAEEPEN